MPQLRGEYHPVFSLVDNRLLAHVLRQQGLLIPLGYPGAAKYVNFNRPWSTWVLNQREDGRRVAVADRPVTWINLPLSEEQARSTSLLLRMKSPKAQALQVTLNTTKLAPVKVEEGWHTVKIELSSGAAHAGENRLEFTWGATGTLGGRRTPAAVQWVYVGPRQPEEIAQVEPAADEQLVLPRDGGLAYYIYPYAGTKLRVRMRAQVPAERCELRLRLLPHGRPALEEVRSETARPAGSVAETFMDLEKVAGQVVRLELWAQGQSCQQLALDEAALVQAGPAPVRRQAPAPRNVLFWMIDNVRADRYSLYDPRARVKTPVIEQLGKTGTLFASAYIQGTESRVSHASIWTSLYPKQHNFIDAKAHLSPSWVTLPEAVQQAGLYTAGWIANGFVSKNWGFGEGWSYFHNSLHEQCTTLHKGQGSDLTAGKLADHAIDLIKNHSDKPFYAYFGTIDPHVSWRGQQPWLDQYDPPPYEGIYKRNVFGKDVEKMAAGSRQVAPRDRQRIIAIYDSTVSYNDQELGRVLKALDEKGIRKETMIVVTADHGEELWDYGRIGHGHSLRESLIAVPLIINYPPLFGRGVVVRQGVDVLSLMPTILDALGATPPATVQGESLLPLAQGIGTGYPRPSLATQYELAHTIRLEQWKLWVGGKGEARLYDMGSKETEQRELAAEQPLATRWLTDALGTFLVYQRSWHSSRWGVASNQSPELPRDLERGERVAQIHP